VEIGARPKFFLALAVIFGLLAYLVIVDLGINAGRIHRGVEVAGLNVGGLTPTEAEDELRARADELKYALVTFHRDGVVCSVSPLEVGWDPRADDTAAAARNVGRDQNLWRSLSERFRAWAFGEKVRWRASTDPRKMRRAVADCERRFLAHQLALDRDKFRHKLRHAIVRWPRKSYRVPIEG
jgi:hypothetical protein